MAKPTKRKCPACGIVSAYRSDQKTCGCGQKPEKTAVTAKLLGGALREYLLANSGWHEITALAAEFGYPASEVKAALTDLHTKGYSISVAKNKVSLLPAIKPGNVGGTPLVHDISVYSGNWFKFGALGDNHLGSKHERLDVLNAAYDLYESEGVTTVFNTGNWIEGEMRLNFHDVNVHGLDDQIDYLLAKYPQKPGITTYFVAGDDHEGWYQRNARIEIGRYLQLRAEAVGRFDLKYLGYVEADVILKSKRGQSVLKVMHPGGGSSYAHSYAPQKIVECVPTYTEALTPTGWKTPDKLQVGDTIMGYNQRTQRCEWTTITALNFGEGETVGYENENFKVRCTRNHRWATLWQSRGGANPDSVEPTNYVREDQVLSTIDAAKDRSKIIQAAPCPSGPGLKLDRPFMNRTTCVQDILQMTSAERRAYIYGMMNGEGTLSGSGETPVFAQNPGPVLDSLVLACFMEGIATGTVCKSVKKASGKSFVGGRVTLLKSPTRMVNSLKEKDLTWENVWCPTTPLGTWVMRHNETITITGNSFQGGEKPSVLLIGHYHKFEYCYPREVHVVQTGCFSANTRIETDKGRVPIANISVGDSVLTHRGRYRKVTETMTRLYDGDWIRVTTGASNVTPSKGQVTATSEHPFLTSEGWKPASELVEGDWVAVKSKNVDGELIPYYRNVPESKIFKTGPNLRKGIRTGTERHDSALATFLSENAMSDGRILLTNKVVPDAVHIDWENRKVTAIEMERNRRCPNDPKKYDLVPGMYDRTLWVCTARKGKERREYRVIDDIVYVQVKKVDKITYEKPRRVFNFSVEDDESYVAGFHVVHNCSVDQSIFMRKQKIQAMVGFTLCRLNQNDDGTVNRFQVEWFPFYDRGFYAKKRNFGLPVNPVNNLTVSGGQVDSDNRVSGHKK